MLIFLIGLGYLEVEEGIGNLQCSLPIFNKEDDKIIEEISKLVSNGIYEIVEKNIRNLGDKLPELTPIKHGVDFKDIANELWHLMFGATNEYLVAQDFFAKPIHKIGEGRYFQCICYK